MRRIRAWLARRHYSRTHDVADWTTDWPEYRNGQTVRILVSRYPKRRQRDT